MVNKRRYTSKDIANAAGVSQSAVSMILNNKNNVSFSDETVQRVLSIAKKFNYKVKENNTKSIANKPQTIAVICPTLANPYYPVLVQSIEQAASLQGYSTFVCNTYRDIQTEKKYLGLINDLGISGIIYTFLPNCVDILDNISKDIPIVIIGDKNDFIDIDTIELNSIKAGMLIADHLIKLGHKKIAFISTTLDKYNPQRIRRLQGIKMKLSEFGLENNLVVKSAEVDSTTELSDLYSDINVGYKLTKQLVSNSDVTAIIGVNDMVAYGIINALSESGYNVPEDFSVCGCDNIFPSNFSSISLTSIEHYNHFKGNNAFEILYKKINSKINKSNEEVPDSILRVEYQPKLIERATTAPPKGMSVYR